MITDQSPAPEAGARQLVDTLMEKKKKKNTLTCTYNVNTGAGEFTTSTQLYNKHTSKKWISSRLRREYDKECLHGVCFTNRIRKTERSFRPTQIVGQKTVPQVV